MNKRQQIHSALVAAKPFLSETYRHGNKEEFICHALAARRRRAAARGRRCGGWIDNESLATKMIMSRIGQDVGTLENWIRNKIGTDKVDAAMEINEDTLQQYRHRWLDELIEEFSK